MKNFRKIMAVVVMLMASSFPVASHAALYHYQYQGGPLTSFNYEGYNLFASGHSVTIEIQSDHALLASYDDLDQSYQVTMSNGLHTFYPATAFYGPFTMKVSALSEGLPTAWDFYMGEDVTTDAASYISSSSMAGDFTCDNEEGVLPGDKELSFWHSDATGSTGTWSLDVTPVPEPSTVLLLLLGVGGICGFRLKGRSGIS